MYHLFFCFFFFFCFYGNSMRSVNRHGYTLWVPVKWEWEENGHCHFVYEWGSRSHGEPVAWTVRSVCDEPVNVVVSPCTQRKREVKTTLDLCLPPDLLGPIQDYLFVDVWELQVNDYVDAQDSEFIW